ncbi:MAG: hypothetical protein IAG10_15580 [Planctomycetaceae bacterium]|nr:hypothetical protein [Planctomycetaceae bacterium]
MNDQLPGQPSRRGHQDLLHALILLGTVPLLFFAAFKLVEKTVNVSTEPDSNGRREVKQVEEVQVVEEQVSPVDHRPTPPKPQPGEAWLREVAAQEQRVAQLRSTPNVGAARIDQLRKRLAILRKLIEQHLDAVPQSTLDEHSLTTARLRLVREIDQISHSVPNREAEFDWKSAFAEFEEIERKRHSDNVASAAESLTAPLKETHRVAIAAIAQESKELRFQMQDISIKQFELQRNTERELAHHARLRAFEVDRAEILRLLKPFISPDYMQLGRTTGDWVRSPESKPLSWSAIERLEALQPTQIGLDALASIATQYGRDPKRRRPMGSFPSPDGGKISNRLEIESTKRAQQLLKKHRETLIEEGLLTP